MKTSLSFITVAIALALTACTPEKTAENTSATTASSNSAPSTAASTQATPAGSVSVKTVRGEVVVPQNPERIAVFDNGMIDTLQKMNVKIGASIDSTRLEYLKPALQNSIKAGTLFEPNYEALNGFKPQLIIIGSRMAKAADELNKIAPTIEMTAATENMRESSKERIDAFGLIFNKQAEAEALKAEIDKSFDEAKAAAAGKGNGLVILVNGGKMTAYGATSRLGGWIHKDLGIPAVDETIKEGSHGQPVSFEYLKEKNPDWLFVLDRSAAIGEEGQAAKDVLNNPLVAETTAWKKGQVVYLVPETYLAAGGAQELINATQQLKEAFNAAK